MAPFIFLRGPIRLNTSSRNGNCRRTTCLNPAPWTRANLEISIVTCVRDQQPALFIECANSVANQEETLEWIIVDDCSSVALVNLYQEVIATLPQRVVVKFIRSSKWQGLSGARNAGIKMATGRWLVILDSDDRLAPALVSNLLALSKNKSLACFEVNYFDKAFSEHRQIGRFEELFRKHANASLDPFLWYDFYYHGIMVRREVLLGIGGYIGYLTVGEDQDVLLRAVEAIDPTEVAFLHTTGYEYRRNAEGVCSTAWPSVLTNYTSTMLDAALRRGAPFWECKFSGVEEIDGAAIDSYKYRTSDNRWYDWHDWYQEVPNATKQ
jgi:glycosyltransferase involved in cell wall biosynthesis